MNRFKVPFHNIAPENGGDRKTKRNKWAKKRTAMVYDSNGNRVLQVLGRPYRNSAEAVELADEICGTLNRGVESPSPDKVMEKMLSDRDDEIRRLLAALDNIDGRLTYTFVSQDGNCYPPCVNDIRRIARIALGRESEVSE